MKGIVLAGGSGTRLYHDKPMLKNQYGQYLLKVIDDVKNGSN